MLPKSLTSQRDVDTLNDAVTKLIEQLPENVERNHALAHLRTAAMWAKRSVTAGPDAENPADQ